MSSFLVLYPCFVLVIYVSWVRDLFLGLLMSPRSRNTLDYKIFNETGKKVCKAGGENSNPNMDTKLIVDELKIREI